MSCVWAELRKLVRGHYKLFAGANELNHAAIA
jgi:hypothetical protein